MLGMPGIEWMVAMALGAPVGAMTTQTVMAPVVSVEAPQDASRVTAYFPFGLTKELTLDQRRMRWRGRAVVGGGVPEGKYPVAVVIRTAAGSLVRKELVDVTHASAPFDAAFAQPSVPAGGTAELTVDTVEGATDVTAECPALQWRHVKLGPPIDGSTFDWGVLRTVPLDTRPGQYTVQLTLLDAEGHTLTRQLTLDVVNPHAS